MKQLYLLCSLLLAGTIAYAQTTEDYAVEITAATQVAPPKITLSWKKVAFGAPTYRIYKKAKTATSWGAPIATLTATDSTYDDLSVIADSAYEYQIWAQGSSLNSYGYIYAGIKGPAIHNKGTILLLVDSTFTDSCAIAIKHLMRDLSGDGWQIIRHDFARSETDVNIKTVITDDYSIHPNVKAALIVGHLAVPYSGNFNADMNPPDGHVPQHDGAWSADVFYSCISSAWTDDSTNTLGSYSANWNSPGDGKWDQIFMPAPASLQLSRIDFYDMPAFAATEVQLMNSYLSKDHVYKMDSLVIIHRALISDNFPEPFSGEAFAANGWRNFPPLVGRDSTFVIPYIPSLASSSYQWAYGCGGGSFNSAGGIGSTSDFAANPVNGIFTMLFGSYFGDWNVQNNFLRAPLCSSTPALTCCWAARPNWFFHHMALGENIGYAGILTFNNTSLYQPTGFGNTWMHVALMGDLSLRTDYIKPPLSISVSAPYHMGGYVTWMASPDPDVIGYYVYRADSAYGYYQKISGMVTGLTFHDVVGVDGHKYYQVRPVKLQSTPSGSYYNLGVGIIDTAYPLVTYPALRQADVHAALDVNIFPNPAQSNLNVTVNSGVQSIATMYVVNMEGQTFYTVTKELMPGKNSYVLNVTGLAPGIYTLVVKSGDNTLTTKWAKL